MGENGYGQISGMLQEKVARFTPVVFPRNWRIREIVAGPGFTGFITHCGLLIFHGNFYKTEDGFSCMKAKIKAPRGMSANSKYVAACGKSSSVFLFSETSKRVIKVKNENAIKTMLTDTELIVLTAMGNIYRGGIESGLVKMVIEFPVLSAFANHNSIYFVDNEHRLFDEDLKPVSIRCNSQTFNVGRYGKTVIRLDETGKMSTITNAGTKMPNFNVSCVSFKKNYFIAFKGTPKPQSLIMSAERDMWPICDSAFNIRGKDVKMQLLALDRRWAYLTDNASSYMDASIIKNLVVSESVSVVCAKRKGRPVYYSRTGTVVFPEVDDEMGFSLNILAGDTAKTPSGVSMKYVGFTDQTVWLQAGKSRCVFTFRDPSLLSVAARPGHSLRSVCVDGLPMVVDVTPSFCKQFGKTAGDLIWVPRKGIVQLVGVASNKFIFLDFSDYSLFSSERYNFALIRSSDPENHTRDIVTTEGNVITINVSSRNCIFMPGDRVDSEYGDATFLGTDEDGNCYVQSDAMKVANIQGDKADISKLKLRRRIGRKATRKVESNGKEVVVSLSVFDRVDDFIADDIIITGEKLCRVIGIDTQNKVIYAGSVEEEGEIFEVKSASLVYRADILGGKHAQFVEVGSPAFDLSLLVPNDLVRVNGKDEYVFKGIGHSGPVFLHPQTQELVTTSYSPLVMSDSFKVVKRTAFVDRTNNL